MSVEIVVVEDVEGVVVVLAVVVVGCSRSIIRLKTGHHDTFAMERRVRKAPLRIVPRT
jgi:hypothetical protein